MQFSDRPENQVGFSWGGQLAEALRGANVVSSAIKPRPRVRRIPRSSAVSRLETTRVMGQDGSPEAIRIRLVHTDKTNEVERLKENGWVFPEKEIVEEV
jgi:hypothetical protein